MIFEVPLTSNGYLCKEALDSFNLELQDLLTIKWFRLARHANSLNALIESKLRLARIEQVLNEEDLYVRHDVPEQWFLRDHEHGAKVFCSYIYDLYTNKEYELSDALMPKEYSSESRRLYSQAFDTADCDLIYRDMKVLIVVSLMRPEVREIFSSSFNINLDAEIREILERLKIRDLEPENVYPAFVIRFLKRLSLLEERQVPYFEGLYLQYTKALLDCENDDSLSSQFRGQDGKSSDGLVNISEKFLTKVVFDPLTKNVSDLVFENMRDSHLMEDRHWSLIFDCNYDAYKSSLINVYQNGKRGTFIRLIYEAGCYEDGDSEIDLDDLEFDKGFCGLVASEIKNYNEYPDGLKIEFFRLCHFAGIEVKTDLYDFSQPCDYETHVYEEVNAEIGTCDSYMRTISFEDEGDVEFTVELSRGSASFMKEHPNSMLEITSVLCKTFSDIEEAMSFARSLEKQRRQWVMDHYPEHRTIQQEVLKNAPKVVIQASPKGQD